MFSIINKCSTFVFVVGLLVVYFQGSDSAPMDGMMDKMCTMDMMQSDPTGMKGKLCGNTMSPENDDSVTIAPEDMKQNDINEEFKQNDINEEFKQNDINEEFKQNDIDEESKQNDIAEESKQNDIAEESIQNDIDEESKQNDIDEESIQNDINEEIKGMMQQMMGGMGGMGM